MLRCWRRNVLQHHRNTRLNGIRRDRRRGKQFGGKLLRRGLRVRGVLLPWSWRGTHVNSPRRRRRNCLHCWSSRDARRRKGSLLLNLCLRLESQVVRLDSGRAALGQGLRRCGSCWRKVQRRLSSCTYVAARNRELRQRRHLSFGQFDEAILRCAGRCSRHGCNRWLGKRYRRCRWFVVGSDKPQHRLGRYGRAAPR